MPRSLAGLTPFVIVAVVVAVVASTAIARAAVISTAASAASAAMLLAGASVSGTGVVLTAAAGMLCKNHRYRHASGHQQERTCGHQCTF
ncbi:MAG: hypothetical protein OEO83_16805 [Alphaproteobacteria bacterium]|nr:hypothetical protein [Alphaproteobacteria bacterium]